MIKASNNPFECSPAIIGNGQPNALLFLGPILRNGNNFSIPSLNASARISGVVRSNQNAFNYTIAPETTLNRIDWIIYTPTGLQHLVGEAFSTIVTSPTVPDPENTVLVKEYKIEGANVGEGSSPIIGDPFITKNQFNEAGDVNGRFYIGQQSNFLIGNPAITEVKGLCNVNEFEEGLYLGKFHYWTNIKNESVWFRHLDDSDPAVRYPFYLPGEVDFELKPQMSILFFHSSVNIPINFEYGYLRFMSGTTKNEENNVFEIIPVNGINHTLTEENIGNRLLFTNSNPVTLLIPTEANLHIAIGSKLEYTQQGNGNITIAGPGIIFITDVGMTSSKGETRYLTKLAENTWSITGSVKGISLPLVLDAPNSTVFVKGKMIVNHLDSLVIDTDSVETSNPRFADYYAKSRVFGPGWYGGHRFFVGESNSKVLAFTIRKTSTGTANIFENDVTVNGNMTVLGSFTPPKILLSRNSDDILISPFYQGMTYSIKGVTSSPYRNIEHRASASGGPGWHAKHQWYVKSNDGLESLAFEIQSQSNGVAIIRALGILKPNQIDLSALPLYSDDIAAAAGGVLVGFAYINSSTGAMHRRLT